MKRNILAVIAVFVLWAVLDFCIHGVILKSAYAATAELWRPMAEMKMCLMYCTTFIVAIVFVAIYARLVSDKKANAAMLYAFLFGIGAATPMAYGTYSVMPIPCSMALTWFLGTLIEFLAAGVVLGLIVKGDKV